jgi:hypothetical protein
LIKVKKFTGMKFLEDDPRPGVGPASARRRPLQQKAGAAACDFAGQLHQPVVKTFRLL